MSLLEIVKSIFYFVDSVQAIKRTVPTVSRAASREAHCQADRGINLSAVESRKLVDRKYCFIAIGDLFTEKISHALSRARTLLEVFYRADLEEERQKMMLNSYNL